MWLTGLVVPLFEVVSSENRQGPPLMFTQLPPGAAIVTSGPRLLNPTLLPAWRMAATAATPGQFAGDDTTVPSLPADITARTLRAASSLMTSRYDASQASLLPRLRFRMRAGVGLSGT